MDNKGHILLKRSLNNFKAGFCILNAKFIDPNKENLIFHREEKMFYQNLKFDKRKESYLIGRIAAKKAVLEILLTDECIKSFSVEFGIFKFPVVKYLRNQNIQVSISHRNNFGIALAFPEEHPMGLDIEKIDENRINSIENMMRNKEFSLINSCSLSKKVGVTILWTLKESLSKLLKTGLMLDFKILEIESICNAGDMYLSTFRYFYQYKAYSKKIDDYIISIVLPKNTHCDLSDFWNVVEYSILNDC
ncbi:hypothetical protein GCM10022393_28240 [Aquimarina addita]|uniref:4'-phosphopantetheinyl transferase domain-containing protein n=1 Tax=Aquimarina addita TaxID=870485 RepID=A0ABP6UM95_9FLAO